MSDPHPHQPESGVSDPEKMSTPIGVTRDLEERAEEVEASTEPEPPGEDAVSPPPGDSPPTHGPE